VLNRPRTLVESLQGAAAAPEDGIRVLDRHGEPTWLPWPVVAARARRVAGSLQALGVAPGDRVALVFPTSAAFLDACFGVLLAGAVPVPLYPPVRLGRLDEYDGRTARMIEVSGARLVLADRVVRRLLGVAIGRARPPLGCSTLDDLPDATARDVGVREEDLALVQFSSGTTREPKAVALTHRALVSQAAMLNSFWPDSDGVRHSGVSWLPLYHDMGLIGAVLTAMARPGTVTLIPPEVFLARPAAWLQAISRYRATISPAPNFAYGYCTQRVRDEEMDGVDLSCWRIALNGAEQAAPSVMRAFARRFARWGFPAEALTPVYGLSEASLAVTFGDIGRPFVARRFDRELLAEAGLAREAAQGRELASVGRAVPGTVVRITGPDGEVLPEGAVGAIECRSASVMVGYLGQPAATSSALRDGWLHTGDLGFFWRDELFVTGRAKDVLLLRGRNHAPEDVESAVAAVRGVRAGCVVAVTSLADDADTEQLFVLAEARRDLPAAQYDAVARLASAAVVESVGLLPDRVVIVPPGTLPRTSSGKLRRQDALRQFLEDKLQPPRRVTVLRLAAAVTRSWIAYLRAHWPLRQRAA
jgi:fatty-acyl-CoA synthase